MTKGVCACDLVSPHSLLFTEYSVEQQTVIFAIRALNALLIQERCQNAWSILSCKYPVPTGVANPSKPCIHKTSSPCSHAIINQKHKT